jgi:hypothetical protein
VPLIVVENSANLGTDEFETISRAVADHSTIKRALEWLMSHSPPLVPIDAVAQDEFSHDIVVPLSESLYLVYDST